MNIGILQSAGIAGTVIECALSTPENDDVFTATIYSKDNGNDKNVGADLKFGNISGIVVAPGSATEFSFDSAMTLYVAERMRLATVFPDKSPEEVMESFDRDVLAERINKVWMSLKRDFLVSIPRIALLAPDGMTEAAADTLASVVAGLSEQGIGVFGPYNTNDYIEQQQFLHFDATLALFDGEAKEVLGAVTDESRTKLLIGIPMVMASTEYGATNDFDASGIVQPAHALRKAVYTVIAVVRCREAYDEGHHDPLPKIYHERRDDSEKVRFAVRKQSHVPESGN